MKTETKPLSGLDPLVTITELSEYLGVPVKTIYEWRQRAPRSGPTRGGMTVAGAERTPRSATSLPSDGRSYEPARVPSPRRNTRGALDFK